MSEYEKAREDLDISFILRSLKAGDGSQKKAAGLLGLSYDQFRGMYRKYFERLKQEREKE